jgi:hypothetical protein
MPLPDYFICGFFQIFLLASTIQNARSLKNTQKHFLKTHKKSPAKLMARLKP